MKRNLLMLLTSCMVLTGCFSGPPVVPPPALSGTFSGQFRFIHRHVDTARFDTSKANITLTLQSAGGKYALTGDTSTLHAGSYGLFTFQAPYIHFSDQTFPKTGTPTKNHLNGVYIYSYDGTILQLLSFSADTLILQYDLKRTQ